MAYGNRKTQESGYVWNPACYWWKQQNPRRTLSLFIVVLMWYGGPSVYSSNYETLQNATPLRWRLNGRDSVSNHQPHDCLLYVLFRRRSKKTWKLRVTGLCAGKSPGTGEFPAQMASNAAKVSIWWRYHGFAEYHVANHHNICFVYIAKQQCVENWHLHCIVK